MAATLTKKQERFCKEYIVDFNGTRAAIAAGYSKTTAKVIAAQNLSKLNIQNQIQSLSTAVNKKLDISVERIRLELARISFSDIRQFYNEDGTLIPVHELSDEAAACLAGIEEEEIKEWDADLKAMMPIGTLKKIRRHDKLKALEMLGRTEGIFEKDNAQSKSKTEINIKPVIIDWTGDTTIQSNGQAETSAPAITGP